MLSGELSIGQWATMGAATGLDAIDISVLFLQSRQTEYLRRIAKQIGQSGIRLAIVNTYSDLTHPDPEERTRQAAGLKADIEAAAELGAEFVRITAGQAHPDIREDEAVHWVLEYFHQAQGAAEKNGIMLVYENHSKPGIWKYPDFSHPAATFLRIADGIADTSIRILYDTANALARGDDPLSLLAKVIENVACVHAADTGAFGKLSPVLLGTGIVPFDDIFLALRSSGFDGLISIEEASNSGEAGLRDAARFVRTAWCESGKRVVPGKKNRNGRTVTGKHS
jgi:sugar phosphate isomerase/epimerase